MIKNVIVLALIVLSLISDIKTYKIKNKIVFPFMLLGVITNLIHNGWEGLKLSLIGLFVPILILFILYILRMLGAGDIKLFGAIGSIMGLRFAIKSMAFSFISGGVIGIILILCRKNGLKRFKHFWLYLKNTFLSKSILPYTDFEDKNDSGVFRFAYAIFVGTIIALILN